LTQCDHGELKCVIKQKDMIREVKFVNHNIIDITFLIVEFCKYLMYMDRSVAIKQNAENSAYCFVNDFQIISEQYIKSTKIATYG